jgi:uncharacterized iron-regulated protein
MEAVMKIRPKQVFFILVLLAATAVLTACSGSAADTRITDVDSGREMRLSEALGALKRNRIIFVGEIHDNPTHHQGQLDVIRALHESGTPVAVGMEMFRKESQDSLDRWVAGEMTSGDFRKVYDDNWNFPWHLYAGIFEYAREEGIPLVGLNVSKGITRQVARGGFQSLDAAQRASLPLVTCHVDDRYMAYIKESFGMHGHGQLDFTYFCEAQLLWDKAMAVHALAYLYEHPDVVLIIVTGRGHAQKMGIPAQIRKRSALPHAVLLPRMAEGLISGPLGSEDADYVFHPNGDNRRAASSD